MITDGLWTYAAGQRVNIDPLVGLGTLVMSANDPDAASSNSASCVQSGSSVTYMLAACSLLGDATSASAAAYKADSKSRSYSVPACLMAVCFC
jgi:hypothetical protein